MRKMPLKSPQEKGFSVLGRGTGKPTGPCDNAPFDGTIASACESVGISLEEMIGLMRWAKESDPGVAQFLDAWDAMDPSERQASGTADTVRQRIGLKLPELLKVVAEVACGIAMYQAQIIAAVSHPQVVAKTVERALTDKGIADRVALHKATGFLPMTKGSQTVIAIAENAQANTIVRSFAAAPRPEETIRRATNAFNESRGLPPVPEVSISVPVDAPNGGEDDDR